MSGPDPEGQPRAAAAPADRGCAIVGFAILGGAVLGLIVGAPAGFAIGMGWLQFAEGPREIGLLVVALFMPLGAIIGAIVGATLLGRRAAGRAPTGVDRILLIVSVLVAMLAVPGLVIMRRIGFL